MSESVVVVGNGASALSREMGSVIDDFDIVVRFNCYDKTGKYRKFVGDKTTIWCVNDSFTDTVNHVKRTSRCNADRIIVFPGPEKTGWKNPSIRDSRMYPYLMKYRKDIDVFPISSVKKASMMANKKLGKVTTGLSMVVHLVLQGFVPHLYGFDLLGQEKGVFKHYYEKRPSNLGKVHNSSGEYLAFRRMIEEGKVLEI